MKKVLAVVCAAVMLLQATAYAETTNTKVNTNFIKEASQLEVSGNLGAEFAKADVTLLITTSDSIPKNYEYNSVQSSFDNAIGVMQTTANKKGEYTFDPIKIEGYVGNCLITVSVNNEVVVNDKEVFVSDFDAVKTFSENVKLATSKEAVLSMLNTEVITPTFGSDMSYYKQLEAGRGTVAANIYANRNNYGELNTTILDDDIFIFSFLTYISEKCDGDMARKVIEIDSSDFSETNKEKLTRLLSLASLRTNSAVTRIMGYTPEVKDIIYNQIAAKNFGTKDEFEDAVTVSVINYQFENASGWNKCAEILNEHKALLTNLNYSKLSEISNNQTLMSQVITGQYKTVAELENFVNQLEKPVRNDVIPSGGGGGGGSNYSVATKPVTPAPTQKPSTTTQFADMSEASWATESVNRLFNKGIVSGVGNNKYEPMRLIAREEFVRMIMDGFLLQKADGEGFNDVANGAWYEGYVYGAYKLGIISGIDKTYFGIGEPISRQDVVTMAYRTLKYARPNMVKDVSGELRFNDADEIAEYAREAVAFMSSVGIVSGMGDNRFGPAEKTTRAQAAVIFDKLLSYVGLM